MRLNHTYLPPKRCYRRTVTFVPTGPPECLLSLTVDGQHYLLSWTHETRDAGLRTISEWAWFSRVKVTEIHEQFLMVENEAVEAMRGFGNRY